MTDEGASDLFTQAIFWWEGSPEKWDVVASAAQLTPITEVPQTDGTLVIVVYELQSSGTPSSHPEGAAQLREASKNGHLKVVGKFSVRDAAQLTTAGFRK